MGDFNRIEPKLRLPASGFHMNMGRLVSFIAEKEEPVALFPQYRRHDLAGQPIPDNMDAGKGRILSFRPRRKA